MMTSTELEKDNHNSFNVFSLVIVSTIIFLAINIFFYQLKDNIDYFGLVANSILLFTTLYLIYVTQRNSINVSGFYYYTSVGFVFVFFGLTILTLDSVFTYTANIVDISVKLLYVFGYSLLAIGVTKWIKYNQIRQDELIVQANTDELTGILNRRSFTKFIDFEYEKAKVKSEPFALIILDIDFFKAVNDTHGHLIGDKILISLSAIMKSFFRKADKVCRWGGEEFAILLPNTSLQNAETAAENIRIKIENTAYVQDDLTIDYTISLGVSEWLTLDENVDKIINRADDALYLAKKSGRNCIRSVRA